MPKIDFERLADVAGAQERERVAALASILPNIPNIGTILKTIRDLDLPDAWITSGAIYQTVWNVITDRPLTYGIKDYDVIYFDARDRSYEAEDRVICRVAKAVPHLADLIEVRNQARVHLWYESRFGRPYRPLDCSMDSLTTYASRTHAVAVRLTETNDLVVHAPFGLANIFGMRLVPNYGQLNPETYAEKADRMKALWPELTIAPWQDA